MAQGMQERYWGGNVSKFLAHPLKGCRVGAWVDRAQQHKKDLSLLYSLPPPPKPPANVFTGLLGSSCKENNPNTQACPQTGSNRWRVSPVTYWLLVLPSLLLLPQEGLLQGSLQDSARDYRQEGLFPASGPKTLHFGYRKEFIHPRNCFQPPRPVPETCGPSLEICHSGCPLGSRSVKNKPIESTELLLPGIPKPSKSFQAITLANSLGADTSKPVY